MATSSRSDATRTVRGLRAIAAAAAVGLGATFLGLSPAAAADELAIAHVQPEGETVQLLVSTPEDGSVTADDLSVTFDGEPAEIEVAPVGGAPQIQRTTILAIDTSTSMSGSRISSAREAATTFLDSVPEDVRVGIVTFNGTVATALEPTTDRDAARAIIEDLDLGADTYLNDALIAAAALAGTEGQRNILLLSDGEDNSQTEAAAAISAVQEAGVRVDVVALDFDDDELAPLQELATAGGGEVIAADAQALTDAFEAEAESLNRQLVVTATIPEAIRGTAATIEVSAGELSTSTHAKIRDEALPEPVAPAETDNTSEGSGTTISKNMMYAGLAAIGLGLLVVLGSLMWSAGKPKKGPTAEQRIAAYGMGGSSEAAAAAASQGGEPVLTLDNAKSAAASMLQRNKGLEARISQRLVAAGSQLKAAEWVLIHGGITIVAGLIGALLGQGDPLFIILFLAVGGLVPWLWLGRQRKKRMDAFNSQLADTLTLISGSLSAGMSLAQSIDSVVKEGREPVAGEFKQALVQSRLGVPLVDALEEVAVRTESQDFAWVVMAIRIQRQVGGNLNELLSTVANTLRERDYLRRQVKTLSAEGILSGWILAALPVGMFFYMLLFRREYVSRLWSEPLGLLMLVAAVVALALGGVVIKKIVKVEV
ncbi:type II secretion system F family protein [Nocardioides sp. AE5]|uniref:type II secretion system F family protein n=1 Tax=Nocardioides sp. AE5 TaxID=2962573 RepID=UPI0028814F63|nr:type II secretion system F family protein [Nocardioides sp. AE5]MDT0201202.1 type II secretion system F family protein [Nocardioides sp. AE5]